MSQYSGMITFYEGKCFTGRKLENCGSGLVLLAAHMTLTSCDVFRVNSIRVDSGAWICFDHPDFKGQQYILEHGEYPEFQRWNSHNDHMGSCKPIRMHGEHYRIELFDGCNFAGQCVEICDDTPFLQSRGFSKNCINSVKVFGDGAWVMYEEPNFRGRMYVVERGDYSSHNEWQAQNPNIQSIRRVVNYF
ncbi:Gamma-crystallin N-B [Takifugu flavidus]|uniref:Gamma-crystallin N-B n=1 Tax=Takifugu flavidus TaxID=433684 RepID=A0A5C6NX55_9TELE|nr:Gamma-crystallin N-B [Takifugu flavidus]